MKKIMPDPELQMFQKLYFKEKEKRMLFERISGMLGFVLAMHLLILLFSNLR